MCGLYLSRPQSINNLHFLTCPMLEILALSFVNRCDGLKPTITVAGRHKAKWQVSYWISDVASCPMPGKRLVQNSQWVHNVHISTCPAPHRWQPTGQHLEPSGLWRYLQEKLESLLLNRQSKTENTLMERKEEISIQGSVPGINLQQACCHIYSENKI